MVEARKKPLTQEQAAACRRLKKIWQDKKGPLHLTQELAAERMGMTQGAVSHNLNGHTSIGLGALMKWAKLLGVRASDIDPALARQIPNAETAADHEWIDITARKQAVSQGHGAEVDEWAETRKLKFRLDSLRKKGLFQNKCEIYYGRGDSMEPRLKDGDALLYDQSDTKPAHGKIFIIRWRGGLLAKRLRFYDGRLWISSDNKSDPQWRDDVPADPEREDFEIVGRVRWIGSWED